MNKEHIIAITPLVEIVDNYDAFLIDLWGVVHNGIATYQGVVECINFLLSKGKQILFVSNAPRSGFVILNKLHELGINATLEMVITSGDLVRYQLTYFEDPIFDTPNRNFYHLGANRNQDILAGLDVNVVQTLEPANFILITAYMDEGEDLDQYDSFLHKGALLKIPAICANPDKEIMNGDKRRYCSGVLADKYQKFGGKVYYFGKPFSNIYEAAFKKLRQYNLKDKSRILMIGDTIETDVVGAIRAKIHSALVLTGNMNTLLTRDPSPHPSLPVALDLLFKKHGATPTWVIPALCQ